MDSLDMTIVSVYVTQKECARQTKSRLLRRADSMTALHTQLTKVNASAFVHVEQLSATGIPAKRVSTITHELRQNEQWRGEGNKQSAAADMHAKCALFCFAGNGQESNETSCYCEQFSEASGSMCSCAVVRANEGNCKTSVGICQWRG